MGVLKNILLKLGFVKRIAKKRRSKQLYRETCKRLRSAAKQSGRVFYLGIPAHANLGDLAQGICIRRWLAKNYPGRVVVEIETNAIVNTDYSVLPLLTSLYRPDDIIVFQSGYTTTDLGGYADEMHRAVMQALPDARMLMLPQTIFFQSEANKQRTSRVYNAMKDRMLFLARDEISFAMAKEMFPDLPLLQYPDIVTTLIGSYSYDGPREGILFCCRDDGEKFYSDEAIENAMQACRKFARVDRIDTTKKSNTRKVVKNASAYIMNEVAQYAKYRVMITDRYHGTILSLVAGTPVIIIKTTDHKVTTGAKWFRGVYDSHVFLADSLEEACELARRLYHTPPQYRVFPYFEEQYYDKLPALFEELTKDNG